jgi:hypothetical protein
VCAGHARIVSCDFGSAGNARIRVLPRERGATREVALEQIGRLGGTSRARQGLSRRASSPRESSHSEVASSETRCLLGRALPRAAACDG